MTLAPEQSLKYLKVAFDTEIGERELPAFRGAIAQKVGPSSVLFHNHLPDGKLRKEYPLIQYKRLGRRPAIICLGEGVEQVHHYFSQSDWDIDISGRHIAMRIDRLNLVDYTMKYMESPYPYVIRDWIALNQADYQLYQFMGSLVARVSFLESRLRQSIAYFAKGVGFPLDENNLQCVIDDITNHRVISVHGQKSSAFDVEFRANLSIPDYVGIGKGASVGMGMVSRAKLNRTKSRRA